MVQPTTSMACGDSCPQRFRGHGTRDVEEHFLKPGMQDPQDSSLCPPGFKSHKKAQDPEHTTVKKGTEGGLEGAAREEESRRTVTLNYVQLLRFDL